MAMYYPDLHRSLLYMLHAQHRTYTAELSDTHKQLSVEYKRIANAELDLIQRHEKNLTRREKKKLQWKRSLAKAAVKTLQSQQQWLQDYLKQCNNLIVSCETTIDGPPVTPWSALPPSDPLSPMSGLTTPTPWSAAPSTPYYQPPQYWDLSMLQERREPSPFGHSWSADSGFSETNGTGIPGGLSSRHPYSSASDQEVAAAATAPSPQSRHSSISEGDEVPELVETIAHTTPSGTSAHKRRLSENAIQLIESRLSVPKPAAHRRVNSAFATVAPQRRHSAHLGLA